MFERSREVQRCNVDNTNVIYVCEQLSSTPIVKNKSMTTHDVSVLCNGILCNKG